MDYGKVDRNGKFKPEQQTTYGQGRNAFSVKSLMLKNRESSLSQLKIKIQIKQGNITRTTDDRWTMRKTTAKGNARQRRVED